MAFTVTPKGVLSLDGNELMTLGRAKRQTGKYIKEVRRDPTFPERIEYNGKTYCRVREVEAYRLRQR